jgi:hypothetical protein
VSDSAVDRPVVDAEQARPVDSERPETSRADRARLSAFRSRFAALYLGLAIVAGAAIGSFVVLLMDPGEETAAPASRSIGTAKAGEAGAIDIADQVQRLYRRVDGTELVHVVASRNTLQDGNGGFLRVRFQYIQPGDASEERDSLPVRVDDAIQYSLCGAGAQCGIPGAANVERGTLLRREALELAVRTLQRDERVENVTVFLRPFSPPDGSNFEGVVYVFNRSFIKRNDPGLLTRPIGELLPGAGQRMTPAGVTQGEFDRINELTQPYLYLYRYQLLGGRDVLMQLQPSRQ